MSRKLPSVWASPTTAYDVRDYSDVEVQVVGTPSPAYTPKRSLDGTTFVACNAYDEDGDPVTSITTAGVYSLPGGGYLRLDDGAASTITIRAGN